MNSRRCGLTFPGRIHPSAVMVAAVGLALLTGCSRPRFEGPQIQAPPPGFIYDANATQGRNVFPEREEISQGAWWRMESIHDTHSSLFITAYAGDATRAQVQAARDAQEERWHRPPYNEYGGLEQVRIDGRTAWGWLETQYDRNGATAALQYKAVVPYDTVSYALEFYTNQPEWMDADTLRAHVMAFGVGRTEVNWPGVGLAGVALLLLLAWLKDKAVKLATPVEIPEPGSSQPKGPEPPPGP